MSECSKNCNECDADCAKRNDKSSFLIDANSHSKIKKVIGIVSGKGGVGKSLVSCLIASKCAALGLKVGILDSDITGPSVPRSFGINEQCVQRGDSLMPITAANGVKIMSINLMLEDETAPVVWRGPVISGVIGQFWSDVNWGELDYLFVDMPPGTGDAALTVFQSMPVDGIVIVSTPQDLVKMIVKKAYNMAKMMNVPVLGIVENMSYYVCPHCGEKLDVFGASRADELAGELGVKVLAKLPVNKEFNTLVDSGRVYDIKCAELGDFAKALKSVL
ncbi:MAG: Mrp/NBP35 family ATP-binding protein [Clostridiales bacterium]|nr:Mrp/NBP35 family ATP-binding protein [Clostridiales bacterium]